MPSLSTAPNSLQKPAYLALSASLAAVGQLLQHRQHLLRAALADRLDVAAFLQQFPGDVERQVGRVDHAAHEAQIGRQQLLRVVHDEDALHVELDARLLVAVPQIEGRLGRDVEQLRVLAATFHPVVRVGQRCRRVVAQGLVELLVLLGRDLALGAGPQRAGLVDRFPLVGHLVLGLLGVPAFLLELDGQADVVAVLADDGTQFPGLQEFVLSLAQVQDHIGAAGGLVDGLDLELARALAAPAHALRRRQSRRGGFPP
jgi:hypothetical protein